MKLTLEDGTEYATVTDQTIVEALGKLDGVDNSFAILLHKDDVYMQTAFQERGLYALEYRDEAGKQYESAVLATHAQVISAFQKYAQADRSWLRDFRWQPLEEA
jgi:hypothetical protein